MDSYPEYGYTYPSNVGIPYPYPPAVMDTVSVSTRRLGYIVDTRIQEEDGSRLKLEKSEVPCKIPHVNILSRALTFPAWAHTSPPHFLVLIHCI